MKLLLSGITIVLESSSPLLVTKMILAPLDLTSLKLLSVFSYNNLLVLPAITSVSLSIKDIGPCFNSPAA